MKINDYGYYTRITMMVPGHGRYVPYQVYELGQLNKNQIDEKYQNVTNAEHLKHGEVKSRFKKIEDKWFQEIHNHSPYSMTSPTKLIPYEND